MQGKLIKITRLVDFDMASDKLIVSIIQPDIIWENKSANFERYENRIASIKENKQVIILPEMFSTGFSMSPETLAENMDGESVRWMVRMALQFRCILTGSIIIEEEGKYYNRMIWVQPDGNIGYYDKRHLFAFAGEDKHYSRGEKRQIVSVNGWKILLQVCYDLRFPVWARNAGEEYDMILYVANWPSIRSVAWKALLQARAIENMCYVVGVNRVGTDVKNNYYSGESSIFGPLGELIWQKSDVETVYTMQLDKAHLIQTRTDFPFLKDKDSFSMAF